MKSMILAAIVTAVMYVALPLSLSAQADQEQHNVESSRRAHHHRYNVADLGTLGGPRSYLNGGGVPAFPASSVMSRFGEVAALGDTLTPDPFGPDLCWESDCYVGHLFSWKNGRPKDLGVLPANSSTGTYAPCTSCGWSSFAYAISDTGSIVGQSETNAFDPLTGTPTLLAVLWAHGEMVNLGTLGGNESTAAAVNNRDEVAGAALNATADPFPGRAPYTDLFIYGDGTEPHAILWHHGKMHDLETLGGPDSAAFFVNDHGEVAGASDVTYGVYKTIENPGGGPSVHPFLVKDGKMQDLVENAPAGSFGGSYGIATWLNNRGQVTGTMNLAGDVNLALFFVGERNANRSGHVGRRQHHCCVAE